MLANNFIENIPNNWLLLLNHLLSALDGGYVTTLFELVVDEWFEQLEGHLLWKTALVKTKLWAYYDYRTARVVHTLSEKVLTEPSSLTLEHVAQ